jgi:hypothetical protein
VKRGVLVLVTVSGAFACALASGACAATGPRDGSDAHTAAEDANTITLRLRSPSGPWKKSLSLKLNRNRIRSFSVCAIRNWQSQSQRFGCDTLGARLPGGTLRLEQNPIRSAARRADSPGWGMLGLSIHDRLEAVLSNTASGNRFGPVHYRVTLRAPSGQVLAESNRVAVTWHR